MPSGTGSKVMVRLSVGVLHLPRGKSMRRFVRPLLLTALAACCGAAFAATTEQAPQGRLPRWAVPQSYQLAFKVDPAQQDFSGTTTIKVRLTQASDHLWLDGSELTVSKVTVTDAAGKLHAGKYVATSFGPGVSEDGFLFELNTPFLVEWGFTPELLQETMAIVHERAKQRLQDKLTHGAVVF